MCGREREGGGYKEWAPEFKFCERMMEQKTGRKTLRERETEGETGSETVTDTE